MVSNLKNHLKDPIRQGDIVKYSNPFADGKDESNMRFVVLEDNGNRVEIKAINKIVDSLRFIPVELISKNHLVKVKVYFCNNCESEYDNYTDFENHFKNSVVDCNILLEEEYL